ncbi:MAG: 23S rRNA (adenine(1618)-N(6))-methyltransferase RlmF [Rhodocyclaceae bacterium]|nr:23S rRNA (adenine(1618)-N(6))-methyltransferase RlmF [Rhodocyclaceae bacterium]
MITQGRRPKPSPRKPAPTRRVAPRPQAASTAEAARPPKVGLHPRNRHRQSYDFAALTAAFPELARHLVTTPAGNPSIDFAEPAAVKALNQALLAMAYGIRSWDIPPGALCPPIPGRVDYLHHLADLLAECHGGAIPRGPKLRVLDIGVGANCIYPLLGYAEYGWRFLGVDMDPAALANAQGILAANGLTGTIALRHQPVAEHIFFGLLRSGEKFDLSLCNPPFHASAAEARAAAERKWRQLGKTAGEDTGAKPRLNFGGQAHELWCPGGERGFLDRMIRESAQIPRRCLWFTSLLSKAETLPHLEGILRQVGVRTIRVIPMAQGQKHSRILAWSFLNPGERAHWAKARWPLDKPGLD